MVNIGGSLEGVGTGLSDSIHTATYKVSLAYIVWRDNHLKFLNGINGDRRTASGQFFAKTEVVIEVGTVNGEVGSTAISSHETHAVSTVRGKPGHIGDASAYGRQSGDLGIVDVCRGTSLLYREL